MTRARTRPATRWTAMAALALGTMALLAVLAPWITAHAPDAQLDLAALKNGLPSPAHPFGTDSYSRDLVSRALFGARTSMLVAAVATTVAVVVAVLYGAAAALAPARHSRLMMALVDVLRSVPRMLVLLAVAASLGALPPVTLGLVLGLSAWPVTSRVVFTLTGALAARPFMEAAVALGTPRSRLLLQHLAPQLAAPVGAAGALLFADMLALEAGLSFIGLGVRPPTASWGSMVQDALPYLATAWWVALVPCACVIVTVLSATRLVDVASLRPGARRNP